jgi:TonB-dependent receptor
MTPPRILLVVALWLTAIVPAFAQSKPSGTITGRVFNPATGEYVRNAEVRIKETGQATTSIGEGEYRLDPVPAGPVTVVVTYSGYRDASAVVQVAAGATATQNFELISALDTGTRDGSTVRLNQFVVSTAREGASKAIMDQRNSMNVTNTVASDTFGDNAEGNIGEFLRHLPGVELEQFFGEVRTVRLGGLGSQYTAVTMDGMSLASADANLGAAGNARAFTMEMASLNSMESIEVSKTLSADMDASAAAGTINLRTKRAFDRAGRRVSLQANLTAHSTEFGFNDSRGPDEDGTSRKIRPGGILEYSDVFLDRRLGVVLNISESNVFQQTTITTLTLNTATTASDSRPVVPTAIAFNSAPRFNKRFSTTLTTDFKVSPYLAVGVGVVYNYADLWNPQRNLTFNTGARDTVQGADPVVSFTTSATNASVVANPIGVAKFGETFSVLPKATYRRGNFELEAGFSYSDSTSWYDPLDRRDSIRDANGPSVSGVTYRAERSGSNEMDWRMTQLAGRDIADGASYSAPALTTNDGRFSRSTLYGGEIFGLLKTARVLPVVWKAGVKSRMELRKFEDDQLAQRYDYAPGGTLATTGAWAGYRSPYEYDLGMIDGTVTSISGSNVFMPDLRRLADLYRNQPGDFRRNWGANSANYYESYVARRRRYDETVNAAYGMATGTLGRLTARAGLRWEETRGDALEPDTRTPAEVRAAGFTVDGSGRATTIPGLDYQFLSRPRVHRKGSYDNFFPSASLKYRITPALEAHFGYSSTIRRPSYADVAGFWTIDETRALVTAPNANLKPEEADNFAGRLAYYFKSIGQLGLTLQQRNVERLITTQQLTAEEFGYTGDDELATYRFQSTTNSATSVRIRSLEFEYSQSLGFLGEYFKRLSVRGSYTRTYANPRRAAITPNLASGGFNYTLGKLNLYTNWSWTDNVPINAAFTSFRRHRTNVDVGGGWRFNDRYSLSFAARNLTNQAYIEYLSVAGRDVFSRHEITGVSWTFAVKATY